MEQETTNVWPYFFAGAFILLMFVFANANKPVETTKMCSYVYTTVTGTIEASETGNYKADIKAVQNLSKPTKCESTK